MKANFDGSFKKPRLECFLAGLNLVLLVVSCPSLKNSGGPCVHVWCLSAVYSCSKLTRHTGAKSFPSPVVRLVELVLPRAQLHSAQE